MAQFNFESWRQGLDLTDLWLLEWRTEDDLPLSEIVERSGLPPEDVEFRLLRLRDRLASAAAQAQAA